MIIDNYELNIKLNYLSINGLEIFLSTGSWTKASETLGIGVEIVWFHALGVDRETHLFEKM